MRKLNRSDGGLRNGGGDMERGLRRLLRSETVFYVILLFVAALAALGYRDYLGAGILAGAAVLMLTLTFFFSRSRERGVAAYVQKSVDALSEVSVLDSPYAMATVRLSTGELLWHNKQFQKMLELDEVQIGTSLQKLLPECRLEWTKSGKYESEDDLTLRSRRYRMFGYIPKKNGKQQDLALLQWIDSTDLLSVRDDYYRTRPVMALILIDNYDELTGNLTESDASTLDAALYRCITEWADGVGGLLRRLERNRLMFLFESKELHRITEEKFSLLDTIHEITNGKGIAATLSIGIGKDGAGFRENYSYAALALEMALSRGGDQAVIKDRYDFSFYGGRAPAAEARSKVRVRVFASSLLTLIEQSGTVFIMGHKNADADAIGAAAGVCALCRLKGKAAKIVVDLKTNSAGKLIRYLQTDPAYRDCFISPQDAMLQADSQSLLIVVDTNRPDQVESKPILDSLNHVALIDHHRRASDYIKNAATSLHDPSASSACELVTELLVYAAQGRQTQLCELTALMAGIVLDTKNFTIRVSSSTFEAAAFLRSRGADPVEVKRLFQSDFDQTVRRYHIIERAQVYRDDIALSAEDREVSRALAGQAADELLGIDGISTSFILFRQPDGIYISARSIGKINVQVLLEPLGGGGNAATAGAQLRGVDMAAAKKELVRAIDRYFEA